MNTHAAYHRHGFRAPAQPSTAPSEVEGSQPPHHRDPSLAPEARPTSGSNRVAWLRPTELAAYAGPTVGRGIDLQAELVRRARRVPATAVRGLHLPTPSTAGAARPVGAQEGLVL